MARSKRSKAQEKRLAKLREQDEKLRVSKTLDDGTVLFRYVQSWQRGWSGGVRKDEKAYTYALDADGNVYGYCWKPVPAGSGLSEHVTYPEARQERSTRSVSTKAKPKARRASAKPKDEEKPSGRTAERVELGEAVAA